MVSNGELSDLARPPPLRVSRSNSICQRLAWPTIGRTRSKRRRNPGKALDELRRLGKLEDGRDGPLILIAHQPIDALGIGALGYKLGIEPGNLHIRQVERLLDFVDRKTKAARTIEHVLEQELPLLAAILEEAFERGAEPIPAGDHMAVLAPGEDPGNGAKILDALGAEAPRRTAADLEMRKFLDRARRLEIANEARILGQLAIGGRRIHVRSLRPLPGAPDSA